MTTCSLPLHHNSSRFPQRFAMTASGALLALALPVLALLVLGSSAHAGAALWSSTNIQYLYGSKYSEIYFDTNSNSLDSRDESSSIITLEHVNEWKYGDNFFFVDITNPDNTDDSAGTNYYGEISPRLSLGKITGADLSAGIIKDVLITTTAEIGDAGDGFHNYLYGLAVDLNLPKTPVFQVNYYIRNEIGPQKDAGSQVTLVWLKPFEVGTLSFAFEGFLDYAFGMDHAEDNLLTAPRLLLDVGKLWGSPGVLQAGIEYQIWRDKFGLDGIDEDVAQAMVKWVW